jgi:hypothetical protein
MALIKSALLADSESAGGQVGFTRLSTTMSALQAVRLLNDVFSRVEAAATRLGSVWKVYQQPYPLPLKTLSLKVYNGIKQANTYSQSKLCNKGLKALCSAHSR